jgi:hypothetical protein
LGFRQIAIKTILFFNFYNVFHFLPKVLSTTKNCSFISQDPWATRKIMDYKDKMKKKHITEDYIMDKINQTKFEEDTFLDYWEEKYEHLQRPLEDTRDYFRDIEKLGHLKLCIFCLRKNRRCSDGRNNSSRSWKNTRKSQFSTQM